MAIVYMDNGNSQGASGTSRTTHNTTGNSQVGAVNPINVNLGTADQDDVLTGGYAPVVTGGASSIVGELIAFCGDAATTIHVCIDIQNGVGTNTSVLRAFRGRPTSGGVLLGTSTEFHRPISGERFYVEAKVKLHDSAGTVEIRLGGATVLSLSGIDTKNGGTAAVLDFVRFDSRSFSNINDWLNVYVTNEQGSINTGFLGPINIEFKLPNGNGTTSNGVGSDGNSVDNYLLVDEASANPADYVDFASTGDKDTYDFANISTGAPYSGGSTPVKGVVVWVYAEKTDTGARSLTIVARLAGVESEVNADMLSNGFYATIGAMFEEKPGGGAWTLDDVNAAEFGVKAGA